MILPLDAKEAENLIYLREREIKQCERQIDLLVRLQENERLRLDSLRSELSALKAMAKTKN